MHTPLRNRKSLTAVYKQVLEEDEYERSQRERSQHDALSLSTSQPQSPPASSTPIKERFELDLTDNIPSIDDSLHIQDVPSQITQAQSHGTDLNTDAEPRTPTRRTIDASSQTPGNDRELHTVVAALKSAVKHRAFDLQSEDMALRAVLEPDNAGALVRHTLSGVHPIDLSIEKLSIEDAQFADKLNHIRERLGSLATSYMEPKETAQDMPNVTQTNTRPAHSTRKVHAHRVRQAYKAQQSSTGSHTIAICFATTIAVLLALFVARSLAEQVRMSIFYDPFHPTLYPLSTWVQYLLPANVQFDVPFATSTALDALHIAAS